MDIRELIRHLRATDSDRAVQRDTGIDRRTVQRYRTWATEHQLLIGPLPAMFAWRPWRCAPSSWRSGNR